MESFLKRRCLVFFRFFFIPVISLLTMDRLVNYRAKLILFFSVTRSSSFIVESALREVKPSDCTELVCFPERSLERSESLPKSSLKVFLYRNLSFEAVLIFLS